MNKDIKPIVVIYIPEDIELVSGMKTISPNDLITVLNGFPTYKYKAPEQNHWGDYLWLSFYKPNIDAPELKVFYPKDFTEIQYQELKDMLSEAIKTLTNEPK